MDGHSVSLQIGGSIMKALERTITFAVLMFSSQALFAQAAPHQHDANNPSKPPDAAMRQMMEMHQKMQADMQAADGQLDALLAEMNGSTGTKKVEAIAALLNRMVQERKDMQRRTAEMHMQMMGGITGDGAPSESERMAARDMQRQLAAERETAEAQLQAQRAAMQAQMEAQKRLAEAERDAQRAVLEQREKAEAQVQDARRALLVQQEKMQQELNRARAEAERAVAQAREEMAKAMAEREEARKQAEEAAAEARALAVKAQAAQADAERALAEARAAERDARQQAEAERARREKEKK
jgi:hypothetical protein